MSALPLIRIFIPTWRFFDRVGPRPRLFVLIETDWRPLFTPPHRRWWRVFFNPAGNLHHANQNLTERLHEELQTTDDVATLTSYRLVAHLARLSGARQFKLVVQDEDVLISPPDASA